MDSPQVCYGCSSARPSRVCVLLACLVRPVGWLIV